MAKKTKLKSDRNVESVRKPTDENGKPSNYITLWEFEQLLKGATKTRYPLRNKAIIQTMFWHGLRVTELCRLRLEDLDLNTGVLSFTRTRLKAKEPARHPIRPDVLRTLRRYVKQRDSGLRTLFLNERDDQFDRSSINYLLKVVAEISTLPFRVNPHMLRHGCGYALADLGTDTRLIQDYLGHKNIQHTVVYTRTSPRRYEKMWDRLNG